MSLAGRGKVPRCDVSGGGGHQLSTVADRGGQEGHGGGYCSDQAI